MMERTRFDDFSRSFGRRLSRRGVLARALALGAGTAAVAANNAFAARTVCRRIGTACTRHSQCCSNYCPTQRTMPRASRNRCGSTEGLLACGSSWCPPGYACIDGGCVNSCISVDPDNGSCILTTRAVIEIPNGFRGHGSTTPCLEDSECAWWCDGTYTHCACAIGYRYFDFDFEASGGRCFAWEPHTV